MTYNSNPTYDDLLIHTERHDIKGWLLKAAKDDEAQTLFEAINRQPPHRLARKLAELLAK
jgi:hypothetical protein